MTGQDEPTKEELVEKIEELEQRQEEQESTMQRMMPDRRQALKGLGLLGGGALLGSSSASGATGNAGQIGTTNDRPDVFVDTLDVSSSVNAQIGTSTNRSQIYGSTIDGTQVNGQIGSSTNRSDIYGDSVDANSVSTGSATINNHASQDHRELLTYLDDSGESVSTTVTIDTTKTTKWIIEVFQYTDYDASQNTDLELDIEGVSSFNFVLEDESGNTTTVSGASSLALIRPTGTIDYDDHAGEWSIQSQRSQRLSVTGTGAPTTRELGQALVKTSSPNHTQVDNADITLSASASAGASVTVKAAIWAAQDRSVI